MKAKVLIRFKDKYTGKIYDKDSIIDISQERFDEMNSTKKGIIVESQEESEEDVDIEANSIDGKEMNPIADPLVEIEKEGIKEPQNSNVKKVGK